MTAAATAPRASVLRSRPIAALLAAVAVAAAGQMAAMSYAALVTLRDLARERV